MYLFVCISILNKMTLFTLFPSTFLYNPLVDLSVFIGKDRLSDKAFFSDPNVNIQVQAGLESLVKICICLVYPV